MSARPSAWSNSAPTEGIFMKFDAIFFEKKFEKIQISFNLTRITGTVHVDVCIFMIISRSILRLRNFLDKRCRENQNHILRPTKLFPRKSCDFFR